jgi:glycosyltransferase involved in cell wall biosynthesis
MRFLFVTPGYPGLDAVDSGSGIGTYVREMASGLGELGHECHVLTWSRDGGSGSGNLEGVQVHYEGRRFWPVLERWWPHGRNVTLRAAKVRNLNRQTPFDWIEIQSDEGVDIGIQRAFPEKVILRVHTTLHQMIETKGTLLNARRRAYLRREADSFRLAARVITHSECHAAALRVKHPELRQPMIVPHGVGQATSQPPPRKPTPSRPRLLAVGTLDLRKGTDRLLAVMRACTDAVGPVELRLLSSSSPDELARYGVAQGMIPHVTITHLNRLSEAQLHDEYLSATALLHLARYESFGLPLIEAAACGLPVIATRTGIAPELLGGELVTLLVDGDATAECTAALQAVLREPDRLSAAIYRVYARRFTRRAMVRQYLQVLSDWSVGSSPQMEWEAPAEDAIGQGQRPVLARVGADA